MPNIVVGAGASWRGSFVNKNCEPWGIYVGSPARKIAVQRVSPDQQSAPHFVAAGMRCVHGRPTPPQRGQGSPSTTPRATARCMAGTRTTSPVAAPPVDPGAHRRRAGARPKWPTTADRPGGRRRRTRLNAGIVEHPVIAAGVSASTHWGKVSVRLQAPRTCRRASRPFTARRRRQLARPNEA